jgi:hypothetical protein
MQKKRINLNYIKMRSILLIITLFVILISTFELAGAQFDRNWRKEIEWAGWIYAGISHCATNQAEYRALHKKLATAVGIYMGDHTVVDESSAYYPTAIKAAMLDIKAKGVNCSKVRSDLEKFYRKHTHR